MWYTFSGCHSIITFYDVPDNHLVCALYAACANNRICTDGCLILPQGSPLPYYRNYNVIQVINVKTSHVTSNKATKTLTWRIHICNNNILKKPSQIKDYFTSFQFPHNYTFCRAKCQHACFMNFPPVAIIGVLRCLCFLNMSCYSLTQCRTTIIFKFRAQCLEWY